MKVSRYQYGRRNVGELQSMKQNLRSPAEVAAEAAAPYEAFAGAASDISEDLMRVAKEQQKELEAEQDKNDQMLMVTDVANAASALQVTRDKANAEGWTDAQFNEQTSQIVKTLLSDTGKYSERNREEIAFKLGAKGQQFLAESEVQAYKLKTDRTREAFATSYDRLGSVGDYEAQLAMIDALDTVKGDQIYDDVTRQQMRRAVEGEATAEAMMVDYRKAVAEGTTDDYLLSVSEKDLTAEAQTAFNKRTALYDKQSKAVAQQVMQERGLQYSQYLNYGITRNTTPDDITNFIKQNEISDVGKMNQLYGRLEAVKNAEAITMSDNYNPAVAKDRKAFDEWLPQGPNVTEREMFEHSMNIAMTKNIAPKWIDGYFNRGAYDTDNPKQFAQVAEDYHNYVLLTDRVPVTITEEARARFEMYHDLRQANTDSGVAANLVLTAQKALTEDAFEANEAAWDMPEYGIVEGASPQETITELLTEKIESDFATRMGINLTEKGLFFDTEKIPPIPPALRREMNRVSRKMWAYTTNEEVAANAAFGVIRSSGWQATDANEGVAGPAGETIGYQYMKNPPEKPFAATRHELSQDIKGRKFQIPGEYKEGTARFNFRTVNVNEIELGEGQQYTNEAGQVKIRWPLLVNGEQLLSREDGETKLEFFEYAELPRVNEEDFIIMEEAHKRIEQERQSNAIQIDPGLKF